MSSKLRNEILLVGIGADIESKLRAELQPKTYGFTTVARGDEGLAKVTDGVDVVVSEISAPGLSGLELLNRIRQVKPRTPVILIDNAFSTGAAGEAARLGAFQFLSKPVDFAELLQAVRLAPLTYRALFPALEPGEAEFRNTGLVGMSRPMRELYDQIRVVAASQIPVLLLGATGTGKELIAKALHRLSSRVRREFVAVNCSAIPLSLLEGELFGHEAGAFTGAGRRQIGVFQRANRGTLFLDEIGDLSPEIQVKLLRFLEDGRVPRLGANRESQLDVRVIAATNCDMEKAIEAGKFRHDLFYRLAGFTIKPPRLDNHREDIPDLARHFLRRVEETGAAGPLRIHREAIEFLQKRSWPGNVRELKNAVHRAVLMSHGQPVGLTQVELACQPLMPKSKPRHDTPTDLLDRAQRGEEKGVYAKIMAQTERSLIGKTIARTGGNKAKAARWLGIKRETLRAKLRQYGIRPPF